MQPVDMGVDHVKLGGSLRHRFKQDCLCCNRIGARSAEPKCARPDRLKLGACHRIVIRAACATEWLCCPFDDFMWWDGGRDRDRPCDPRDVNEVLARCATRPATI